MTSKVIQGFFIGGGPRLMSPVAQPTARRCPPGSPVPAFAGRQPVAQPRLPGPPAPAFAGRPTAAQRHGAGDAFSVDPGQLGLASGGGRPLPEAVRGKMEAALGADFSAVRVHVGPQAERIGAIAFTLGSDIYFAPGRFQPETVQGQQLLGHELAHVVQQRHGRVRNPLGSGVAVVQDRALEAEADRLGQRAAAAIISQPRSVQRSVAPVYRVKQPLGRPRSQRAPPAYLPGNPVAQPKSVAPLSPVYRVAQVPQTARIMIPTIPAKTRAPVQLKANGVFSTPASGTIQCAYFARRALGGVLGGGDLSDNPHNKGVFHEHLFFEDGQEPSDIGFFADGLHADLRSNRRLYVRLGGEFGGVFDDGIMRMAVEENRNPGNYALLGNNCQAWITRVLASYNRIAARYGDPGKAKTHTPEWVEMEEMI